MLQIVFRRTENFEFFAVSLAPLGRNGNFLCAGEILAGDRPGLGDDIVDRARCDNFAAVDARAGADVDNEIRRAHRVLVMLDDQNRVSKVAQMAKRIEKLIIIALVKADGGLVENVENAHKARANLGCKPDSLALAAGERPRRARKRQIGKPDRLQKAKARANFPQNLLGDDGHGARELQMLHKVQRLTDREPTEVHDAQAADRHGKADIGQAVPVALRAGALGHAFLELFSHRVGLRFR